MFKWKEESQVFRFKSKAKNDQAQWGKHASRWSKARRLTPNSQVVNAKEIKNAVQWRRKRNSLCADMEKIWMVCKENLARHNIPLKPIPNPEPGPNSPQFSEGWERRAGCRRKVWSQQRLKGRSCLHSIKVQGEGAGADVDAAVTYPEGPHRIISGYAKQ